MNQKKYILIAAAIASQSLFAEENLAILETEEPLKNSKIHESQKSEECQAAEVQGKQEPVETDILLPDDVGCQAEDVGSSKTLPLLIGAISTALIAKIAYQPTKNFIAYKQATSSKNCLNFVLDQIHNNNLFYENSTGSSDYMYMVKNANNNHCSVRGRDGNSCKSVYKTPDGIITEIKNYITSNFNYLSSMEIRRNQLTATISEQNPYKALTSEMASYYYYYDHYDYNTRNLYIADYVQRLVAHLKKQKWEEFCLTVRLPTYRHASS